MRSWGSWVVLAAVSCTACGGYAIPAQHVTGAETAIAAARVGGAEADPQAATHLKLAEEEYASARRLTHQGDEKDADFMFLRAEADAQLAQSFAQKAVATEETRQTVEQMRALVQPAGRQ
jgi:hypothetical protein